MGRLAESRLRGVREHVGEPSLRGILTIALGAIRPMPPAALRIGAVFPQFRYGVFEFREATLGGICERVC